MNTLSLLSDAKYFDESSTKFAALREMLDSKDMKTRLSALKRLLAVRSCVCLTLRVDLS